MFLVFGSGMGKGAWRPLERWLHCWQEQQDEYRSICELRFSQIYQISFCYISSFWQEVDYPLLAESNPRRIQLTNSIDPATNKRCKWLLSRPRRATSCLRQGIFHMCPIKEWSHWMADANTMYFPCRPQLGCVAALTYQILLLFISNVLSLLSRGKPSSFLTSLSEKSTVSNWSRVAPRFSSTGIL